MSDLKTTIVLSTPLHTNITKDNCNSVANIDEAYKQRVVLFCWLNMNYEWAMKQLSETLSV